MAKPVKLLFFFLSTDRVVGQKHSNKQRTTLALSFSCFFSSLRPSKNKINGVVLYLQRSKLIDALRFQLRSNPTRSLLLKTFKSFPKTLDTFVATQVLRSAPSPEIAISFFEFLKTLPGFTHNQNTCHALAKILSNAGLCREFHALMNAINSGEYSSVSVSFMDLLRWHAAAGDLEAAVRVWTDMKSYYSGNFSGKKPCTESYNLLLNLYAQNGRDSESVQLFTWMINQGALPNSRTYTVIIKHLCRVGKLNEALEIFKKLPSVRIKRTSLQYFLLVEGFARTKQVDLVKFLVREMQRDGILPGRALLTSLKFLQEDGLVTEIEEVNDLFPDKRIGYLENPTRNRTELNEICSDGDSDGDSFENEDLDENEIHLKPWFDPNALASSLSDWDAQVVTALEIANFVWTTRLVCKLLRAFKRADTAWEFFCWVARQPGEFAHDVHTVSRMIVILAKDGNVELVDQLISKVNREGIQLSFTTVRLVIDYYGFSKNSGAALKIFRVFSQNLSKFNNGLLYSSLIRTFVKCNRALDAMDLLEEMLLSGILPDIQTFSGLMQHFASNGDLKMVQQLFGMIRQSCIEPDAYTFKILIHAYCKNGRAALAMRVFEDMLTAKLMPDLATKSLLVNSLWKEGKLREAAAVEDRIGSDEHALPVALPGHVWTVSNADLMWVYGIYTKSFARTGG